jgi:hypothetical protein
MCKIFKITAKFVIVAFLMTILCTAVWQNFVTDVLYNCTDPAWLDFLSPGNWVHFHNGEPVAFVPVITGGSMSDPDTIKEGWSVARLWHLWDGFVIVSAGISVFLARIRWIPERVIKELIGYRATRPDLSPEPSAEEVTSFASRPTPRMGGGSSPSA